jgi:hypothetical protein
METFKTKFEVKGKVYEAETVEEAQEILAELVEKKILSPKESFDEFARIRGVFMSSSRKKASNEKRKKMLPLIAEFNRIEQDTMAALEALAERFKKECGIVMHPNKQVKFKKFSGKRAQSARIPTEIKVEFFAKNGKLRESFQEPGKDAFQKAISLLPLKALYTIVGKPGFGNLIDEEGFSKLTESSKEFYWEIPSEEGKSGLYVMLVLSNKEKVRFLNKLFQELQVKAVAETVQILPEASNQTEAEAEDEDEQPIIDARAQYPVQNELVQAHPDDVEASFDDDDIPVELEF